MQDLHLKICIGFGFYQTHTNTVLRRNSIPTTRFFYPTFMESAQGTTMVIYDTLLQNLHLLDFYLISRLWY